MSRARFTGIPHKILEELYQSRGLTANELYLFLCIARDTYGWGKLMRDRPISWFVTKTGMSKSSIRKAFNGLVEKKVCVIFREASGSNPRLFGIQENVSKWELSYARPRAQEGQILMPASGHKRFPPVGTRECPPVGTRECPPVGTRATSQNGAQTLENTGPKADPPKPPRDMYLETCIRDNITETADETPTKPPEPKSPKPDPDRSRPLDGVRLDFRSGFEGEKDPDEGETHFEVLPNWHDRENFRGRYVVLAYRILYGSDKKPNKGDLSFASKKLTSLLPGVSGPRKRRDLEAALILASKALAHGIAQGQQIGNPWAYVFTTLPDFFEPAREYTHRIELGYNPDDPATYVWDAEHATLRSNKRREAFQAWQLANEERNSKRRTTK